MAKNYLPQLGRLVGHMTQYAGEGSVSQAHYQQIRGAYQRLAGEETPELAQREGRELVENLRKAISTRSFYIRDRSRKRVVEKALDAILETLEYREQQKG